MTTLTQLKKLAKDGFIPFMKENGFEIFHTFTFVKKGKEEIFFVIYPEISHGGNLRITAVCHTDEMQELFSPEFPKYISRMVGGYLEPGEDIAYENRHIWKIDTEEMATEALKEIKSCLEESAFSFFDSISLTLLLSL